jgi:hypothetical protein
MVYKDKDKLREYQRKYYQENKEELDDANKNYRDEHREEMKEYKKEYYEENKEEFKKYKKEQYEKNKEAIIEESKKYYQEHKEHVLDRTKEHYKQNREKILAYQQEKIICECGMKIQRNYSAKHKKTKIHKSMKVHRLVAYTFLPKPDNFTHDLVVNHIDNNRLNNYYKNLEWCTSAENTTKHYTKRILLKV